MQSVKALRRWLVIVALLRLLAGNHCSICYQLFDHYVGASSVQCCLKLYVRSLQLFWDSSTLQSCLRTSTTKLHIKVCQILTRFACAAVGMSHDGTPSQEQWF